jgi:hypothetical protein
MPDTTRSMTPRASSPPRWRVHTNDATAGHDVSMEVNLAAGVPVGDVESTSHKILPTARAQTLIT